MSKRKRVRLNKPSKSTGSLVMTEYGYAHPEMAKAASRANSNQPQLMNLSGKQLPPKRGVRELLNIYSESPWLRAIVSKIARGVAETDWVLYAKRDRTTGRYMPNTGIVRGHKLHERSLAEAITMGNADEILDHPLLDFLRRGTGNPRLLGFTALEVTQKHLDLVGEAFWLIEPDDMGVPYAYWPLPPSWVTNFPSEGNPYYDLNIPGGNAVKIPTTMIVPFIDADPQDPYGRGTGIAKSLDDEIQIDEYAAKHAKSFFLNRARPDIIVSGQFINPKDAERLEKQWLSEHQGFWRSFKPLFFSQKIDVKELSQSFESLQMVQMRKHERDTFVSVFGAPPEKFGIIGESKRSTINAADYFWNKDLIKPRVELIRRMVQEVLVPRYDDRIILYYDTPVIQDEEFKLNVMKQAPWAATINEWRKEQGRESLGEVGDMLMIPMNQMLVPIKKGGKPMSADDVAEQAFKLRGNYQPGDASFETKTIVDEVTSELMGYLEEALVTRSLVKTEEG